MSDGVLAGWVPAAFLDEVRFLRTTPDAWLRIGDHPYLDGSADNIRAVPVDEGELVTFHSLTTFADVRLRWTGDAREAAIEGEVAAGASDLMIVGDHATATSTVDGLINHLAAHGYAAGTYPVQVYRWCDGVTFLHRGGVLTRVGAA